MAKTATITVQNATGTFSSGDIRRLGTLDHNGNTYEYYLARIDENTTGSNQVQFDVEFIYVSADLPEGKMSISVYGGFVFLQLSNANYRAANLTDKLHFPYHKDFERQKFKGIMKGNILLAGFEQQDGTILPNDKLKIAKTNLVDAFANTILQYVTKNILRHTVTCSVCMTHRNNRHRMRAPIFSQSKICLHKMAHSKGHFYSVQTPVARNFARLWGVRLFFSNTVFLKSLKTRSN